MKFYYSPSQKGFYVDALVYPNFPDDAVEISEKKYHELHTLIRHEQKEIVLINGELIPIPRKIIPSWGFIRKKRNSLLKNTDYTQMPDYPGDKQKYSIYRQELRDIPQKFSNPEDIVWPTDPKDKPKQ